ncbi:MAG: Multi-sensor signal transduction histidine kinase [Verrucomicrobiaceae bacterium]|nr:Multi-sensor signal transduction histidine kinase [Verrucomicrobiaceae bacterium]
MSATTPAHTTVFIVDDDQGLVRLMEKTVRREGFATASAHSGEAAIARLADHPVDLMLLDLKLPDMTGGNLLDRLGELARTVPFIVITGQGDERLAVEMMRGGALDYLVKDAQFLELLPAVVNRTLAHLERKKRLEAAEQELKKQHAFSASVLEASGAIMLIADAAGRLVQWNQACEKVTGWSFGEMRGRRFWDLLHSPKETDAVSGMAWAVIADPRPREQEGSLVTSSGERRLITWSITTLRDQQGTVEFIIASGIDTTERKRLEEEVLEISSRERRRMGEDLHDGVCQVLGGIDMLAKVLAQKLARKAPAEAKDAAIISGYVKKAMTQARCLARGLSPVELETNGLMAALQELALSSEKLFPVRCQFQCDPPVLMDDNVKATHLYRIAQESIHNAIKHGHASHIRLCLATKGKELVLSITDDGSGFPAPRRESKGMGLRTMKYRAGNIGGVLEIQPAQPQGTRVICRFPAI